MNYLVGRIVNTEPIAYFERRINICKFIPSRLGKIMQLRMVEVICNLFADIAFGWDVIVGTHTVDEDTSRQYEVEYFLICKKK